MYPNIYKTIVVTGWVDREWSEMLGIIEVNAYLSARYHGYSGTHREGRLKLARELSGNPWLTADSERTLRSSIDSARSDSEIAIECQHTMENFVRDLGAASGQRTCTVCKIKKTSWRCKQCTLKLNRDYPGIDRWACVCPIERNGAACYKLHCQHGHTHTPSEKARYYPK